jgi:hypothetical protein
MSDSGQRDDPSNPKDNEPSTQESFLRGYTAFCLCWVVGSLKKIDSLITALATVLLAAITAVLTLIAYWQYSDTTLHDTLVANNRAWIAPIGIWHDRQKPFIVGEPINYFLEFKNVGKGPALRLKWHVEMISFLFQIANSTS